jgi:hypothetical protein
MHDQIAMGVGDSSADGPEEIETRRNRQALRIGVFQYARLGQRKANVWWLG